MGPIPLGALCPRNDACGTLVRDSIPTGYKLMRRLPHSEEGLRLGFQLTKRNPHFNGERGINSNAERTYIRGIMGPGIIVAWHALSPSTPRAFRRDPPGSGG